MTQNIMDVLTPRPPSDPARKNISVNFGTPKAVNTIQAKGTIIKGTNRTVTNIKTYV